MTIKKTFLIFLCIITFTHNSIISQTYTRGIGIYPGNPKECYAPTLQIDSTYRNIALHCKTYHSSSYDYNLTAQLVTDGIITNKMPSYMIVTTNQGVLPRREREWAIDRGEYTHNILIGNQAFLQYQWKNMAVKANQISLVAHVAYYEKQANKGYSIKLLAPNSNGKWIVIAQQHGNSLPGTASKYKVHSDPNKVTNAELLPTRNVNLSFNLHHSEPLLRGLRLQLDMPGAAYWTVTQINFAQSSIPVTNVLPSAVFKSAWMSATNHNEWVKIDLGTQASFNQIKLHWLNKATLGSIQVSVDNVHWTNISKLSSADKTNEVINCRAQARYIRVNMQASKNGKPFVLSEVEVMGRGGLIAHATKESIWHNNLLSLNGGNWHLQRASQVQATGEQLSLPYYNDAGWIVATVPATVLTSYVNIGALANPNIADNLFLVSESFFNSNFWYRKTFNISKEKLQQHIFLNFDGINWKANIFLNGKRINRIEGAFIRSKTDVTQLLKEGKNVLAVEIIKTQHPGAVKEKNQLNTDFNGGILGADNPTFHATIGWDWISTIRGRNIGIWNDVYLTQEGSVTLSDPVVTSQLNLPDTLATLTPSVLLTNNESHRILGILKGWIGNNTFEKSIMLPAHATVETSFLPSLYTSLQHQHMHLWWPNGYGEPYLYDAGYTFQINGKTQNELHYRAGIRQMSYKDVNTRLTLYINGKRFVPLGGNWGFSENNLNYRAREYDIAVKYHKYMNCNMIRNWVGQTGDKEFYDACDHYGIMVWQDFWLANPADGPDPQNHSMFLRNAKDYIYRIRQHPSIALYCGRNEGYPPKDINDTLQKDVKTQHPGLLYISSSADDGVSGHGPYWAVPDKTYFESQTGKLHSERGMPNIMTYEGLARTLAPQSLWQQCKEWGQHDYVLQGAQRGSEFNAMLQKAFGKIESAQQFTQLSQWINYNGYRAMFESGSKYRLGLLIWMSHPCWPSMTWQTYDYYFEPTAAFFGVKKACEPLHIQWNASTRNMEVVNINQAISGNLRAQCEVLDMWGKKVQQYESVINLKPDTTVVCTYIPIPDISSKVYYLQMKLLDANNKELSTNFYVCSTDEGNLQALHSLPQVLLQESVTEYKDKMEVTLYNPTQTPAMMIRLQLKGSDGEQILPVYYTDNYFHLMPGAHKTITIKWKKEDTRGSKPVILISALNVTTHKITKVM